MPDFSFSEDNAPSQPAPPSDTPASPPKEASKFEFLSTDSPPVAPAPVAPAPVAPAQNRPAAIPNPPIPPGVIPNPPIPPGVIPNPPLPKTVAPPAPVASPQIPAVPTPAVPTPAVPTPAVPTPAVPTPAVPTPAVPTPAVPTPAVPTPAVPTVSRPVAQVPTPPVPLAPRPVAQVPTPQVPVAQVPTPPTSPANAAPLKPRPSAIPIPSPTMAPPASTTLPEPSVSSAPQDNYSLKMWSFGNGIKGVLDQMDGLASWVLRVACVVGVTALAYIVAATLFGSAGHLEANPNAATLVKNLGMASQALRIALIGAAISSLILGYIDNRLGAIVAAIGFGIYIGAPLALKSIGLSAATSPMIPIFRLTGYILVMIGLFKALCDAAVWLYGLPDRVKTRHANVGVANQAEAKQRIIAREANMTSPCWKLPFCRESIRKQCPAFLAKTTCWKFGRGCYCDEEMISRIVRGEALDIIKAPTRQSRQGKPPCERCYIYLEHQTYKFRMLSPLALPVTILTSWLAWPIYSRVFGVANSAFDGIWNSLSFNVTKFTPNAVSAESQAAVDKMGNDTAQFAHYAQNMFGVLLGFMLLIYLSKAIEWAIFKAKW